MAKTMISKPNFMLYFALFSLISTPRINPTQASSSSGFTIDLIRRDSTQSISPSQGLLANSLQRSLDRVQRFINIISDSHSPESEIMNADGEYLMKYSIGSPPVASLAVADTGSDVIWTQCQPCLKCFNQSTPIFDPKKSTSFRRIPCTSAECKSLEETYCSRRRENCLYYQVYGDGSFSQGQLAKESITLSSTPGGKRVSFSNITFGCGFRNGVVFAGGESGIVGLGGGEASLVRQLGPVIGGKFSYCLMPLSDVMKSSKLHFGANADVPGNGAVSTPLVSKEPDTFYYLTLEGISVGKERFEIQDSNSLSDSGQAGNIIIDSGTTLTMLPGDLYVKVERAMERRIKLRRIQDPLGVLNLCFLTRQDHGLQSPDVTVHFKGADVKLRHENVFVRTSDDCLCLAAKPAEPLAIYGNIAQINFLVGYDLVKRTVTFKPTDCAK